MFAVAPDLTVSAAEARAFIRGSALLPGGDFGAFFGAMPEEEQLAVTKSYFERGLDPVGRGLMANKTKERSEDAAWELTEGDRIRRDEPLEEEEE